MTSHIFETPDPNYGRPWNRADHYIFILSFLLLLLLLLLSFFPRLIYPSQSRWMSAILAHMVWP